MTTRWQYKTGCLQIDRSCRSERVGWQWVVRNGMGEEIGRHQTPAGAWKSAYRFIRNRQENPAEAV